MKNYHFILVFKLLLNADDKIKKDDNGLFEKNYNGLK